MNKSKIIMLALALSGTTAVFGQQNTGAKYTSIGPVVGMGHSWVSGRSTTFKPAGYLGVGLLYSRYEHWAWGGTVTASHEGFSYDIVRNNVVYNNTIDPVYLRITPRAYYFFGDYKSNIRPKVFLGPSLGVKMVEDSYIDATPPTDEITRTMTGDMFNTLDFGMNGGAGVNVKISKNTWLNLDGDYYHGLTNAMTDGSKNRSLRLNVGFMFGI